MCTSGRSLEGASRRFESRIILSCQLLSIHRLHPHVTLSLTYRGSCKLLCVSRLPGIVSLSSHHCLIIVSSSSGLPLNILSFTFQPLCVCNSGSCNTSAHTICDLVCTSFSQINANAGESVGGESQEYCCLLMCCGCMLLPVHVLWLQSAIPSCATMNACSCPIILHAVPAWLSLTLFLEFICV